MSTNTSVQRPVNSVLTFHGYVAEMLEQSWEKSRNGKHVAMVRFYQDRHFPKIIGNAKMQKNLDKNYDIAMKSIIRRTLKNYYV